MTYSHRCKKTKDVPDAHWRRFSDKVKEVLILLPTTEFREADLGFYNGHPIIICRPDGLNSIKQPEDLFTTKFDINFLSFNGDARNDMDYETFMLRNKGKQTVLEQDCKTDCKPYDFFVTAALILAHNLCHGCFKITSMGGLDNWQPVQEWLCNVLKDQFQLPNSIK